MTRLVAVAVALTLAACGGSSAPTEPPTGLAYSTNPAEYTVGMAIVPNTPTHSGGVVASYSVSPALPPGLNVNPSTGVIAGTPAASKPTADYTVTATNTAGGTTAIVSVTVNPSAEPHEVCFPVAAGNHAGITCLQCHVTLPVPLQIGSCSSVPYPSCTRCHSCASVQPGHTGVQGFSCVNLDQRCYECHPRGSR